MEEQINLNGKERFSHLEDKIYRVSEVFKGLLTQNHNLKEEIKSLRQQLLDFETRYQTLERMVMALRDDKEKITDKIRLLLAYLDKIEKN